MVKYKSDSEMLFSLWHSTQILHMESEISLPFGTNSLNKHSPPSLNPSKKQEQIQISHLARWRQGPITVNLTNSCEILQDKTIRATIQITWAVQFTITIGMKIINSCLPPQLRHITTQRGKVKTTNITTCIRILNRPLSPIFSLKRRTMLSRQLRKVNSQELSLLWP